MSAKSRVRLIEFKSEFLVIVSLVGLALALVGCGAPGPVEVAARPTSSPTVAPTAPSTLPPTVTSPPTATATTTPVSPTATPSPTPVPTATPTAVPTATPAPTVTPTATPEPDPVVAGRVAPPPVGGNERWIDFNLSDGFTRLMEGRRVVLELPSAYGYGFPGQTDDFYSTAPGVYSVYAKSEPLVYDGAYSGQYFMGWVGFDPSRANGFHSFLMDDKGQVVDSRLGPISHGCVRTTDWRAVYDFAQFGMPVIVHGLRSDLPVLNLGTPQAGGSLNRDARPR